MCHPFAFWPPWFLTGNQLLTFVLDELNSLASFKVLFGFGSLTILCLSVNFFEFILLGVYWAAWMCVFVPFIRFGKFLAIISSNIFFTPFSLSLSSVTPLIDMLICLLEKKVNNAREQKTQVAGKSFRKTVFLEIRDCLQHKISAVKRDNQRVREFLEVKI